METGRFTTHSLTRVWFFFSVKKWPEIYFLGIFESNLMITSLLQNDSISFSSTHWIKINWNIEVFFLG